MNLDEKTIKNVSNEPIITVNGKLSITNGVVEGEYTAKVATINVGTNATLELVNTNVDRTSNEDSAWETISVYGTMNINSGKVNSNNYNTICMYGGVLNISGDTEIIGTSSNYPTINMEYSEETLAEANITGGTVISENSIGIYNSNSILNISGEASIIAKGDEPTLYFFDLYKNVTSTISGGKIIHTGTASAISSSYYYGTVKIEGDAEITSTSSITIDASYLGFNLEINRWKYNKPI